MGPYIPTSPVKDLSTEKRIADEARPNKVANSARNRGSGQLRSEVARSARTQGEVLFGDAESVDEWMNPSPVLGVVTESTDGPMTPPPFLQLECNQLGVSPESTDGEMTPTRGELMETAEINDGFVQVPPFNGELDTVEEHLRQTTESSEEERLQSTESSVQERLQKTTGSSTRRHLQPTTDSSETATIVVPVERASTRAMVYPNSKPVDQLIIIENNNRHFPVMGSDATEVRGSLE